LSFLFSLRNKENRAPFIANLKPDGQQFAIYCYSDFGPTFGGGNDVHISNNADGNQKSYSNLGHSYQLPPGTADSVLAGSQYFTPTEIEVFI
jgi:hypothetical protein